MTTTPLRPSGSPARRHHGARAALLLATTALTSPLLIASAQAQTLPAGGSVAAGSVAIAQPSARQLTVTQGSQSAVVNWQGFSVGQGSSVTFAQPNASSAILNRVTGSATSSIAGSITANGSVYLVNPNGIAITPTGTVNAGGGFVASTLGISDSDFMAGKRTFTGNGASAPVSNAGTITVGRGGYAALIGGTVSNAGAISVPLGKAGLGSGEQATLDFSGDGFLQVAVPTQSGGKSVLIRNAGSIMADGGSVVISAATAREAARNAINISGTVQARSISGRNGLITIGGGAGGRVRIAGRLDASSADAQGGRLVVTGRNIKLKNATLDASGKTGGGTINIGGGRQGQGPLQRAQTTTIDSATTIKADATQTGNGGNVTVWSDNLTTFAGTISARGGALSGDGGEAEVSGKAKLAYTGFTDLSAANGAFGNLLLDPYNITIQTSAGSPAAVASGSPTDTFTATANTSILQTSVLNAALQTSNVNVTTGAVGSAGGQAGTITVSGAIGASSGWTSANTLTLNAASTITISAAITGANGKLVLNPGPSSAVSIGGAINVNTLTINGTGAVTQTAAITAANLALLGSSSAYTLTSSTNSVTTLAANAASLSFRNNKALAIGTVGATSGITATGALTLNVNGNITDVTAPVSVGSFTLTSGNWSQSSASLPTFNAGTSFKINGGTFLRVKGGDGLSLATAYQIADIYGLQGISGFNSNFALANDIDATSTATWNAGKGFVTYADLSKDFNGNNHTITGLTLGFVAGSYINGQGLFDTVESNGSIRNLTLSGGSVSGGPFSQSGPSVGPLAGLNQGVITNVTSSMTVNAKNSGAGGLVGSNTGTITNSSASGAVNGADGSNGTDYTYGAGGLVGYNSGTITVSHASGAVTGNQQVGGLVGQSSGTVSDSYATGTATGAYNSVGGLVGDNEGGSITRTYATGTVTNTGSYQTNNPYYTGGLVGYMNGGSLSRSYSTGAVNAPNASATGGLVGGLFGGATIGNSYTTSAVNGLVSVGGLVGIIENSSAVTSAYANNTVVSSIGAAIGGVVGANGPSSNQPGALNAVYWNTTVSGIGAATGQGSAGNAAGRTTAQFRDVANQTTNFAGFDFANIWSPPDATHDPQLYGVSYVVWVNSAGGFQYGDAITPTFNSFQNGDTSAIVTGLVVTTNAPASPQVGQIYTASASGASATSVSGDVYRFVYNNGAVNITPRALTLSLTGSVNKIYDGTTNATLSAGNYGALGNIVNGDVVSLVSLPTSGTYDSKNAGTGKTVTVTGLMLTGANAANYSIASISGAIGAITQAPLTQLLIGTTSKTYNRSTAATLTAANYGPLGGVIAGDAVSLTSKPTSGAYSDFNAGTGKTVTVSGLSLTGADAANYTLTSTASGVIGTILQKTLTPTLKSTVVSKVYDGATTATVTSANFNTITTAQGLVSGDSAPTLSFGSATSTYDTKAVGTGKTVTVSGLISSNSNYVVATVAGAIGTITARPITISLTGTVSKTYDSTNTATLTQGNYSGLIAGDNVIVSNGGATYDNANTGSGKTISVSGLSISGADSTNYTLSGTTAFSAIGVINAATLTYGANAVSRLYGDANPMLGGSVTGFMGSDTLLNATTGALTFTTPAGLFTGIGNYGITGAGLTATNGNYVFQQAAGNAAALTIAQRPVTLSGSRVYDATTDANAGILVIGNIVNGDSLNVSGSGTLTSGNVGVNALTSSGGALAGLSLDNPNYTLTGASGSVTISPATLTYVATTASRHYGDAILTLTGAVTGFLGNDTQANATAGAATFATTATVTTGIGSYSVAGSGLTANNSNYLFAQDAFNATALTITARPLMVTADAQSRVYGDANPALTYAVGGLGLGLVNGDALSGALATSATTTSNVGGYAITQGSLVASSNYTLTYAGANLTVGQRALMVTVDAQSRIYGNANPALTYAVGGLVNGDALSGALATSATPTSNVGGYAIAQGSLVASSNYALTYAGANLMVNPRALRVTADAQSRIYGDANPALTYAVGGLGLVNGDAITGTLTTSATPTSNVGGYAITQGSLAAPSNYAVTYAGANLTVGQRALTISADAQSRIYGDANPALTYAVGGLGLVNGDAIMGTLTTSATTVSAVGSYAIAQGSLAASSNYALTYAGANLTVGQRALMVTADAQSRIYGDANPALTYAVGGLGLVNGDVLSGTLTTSATTASAVGSYAITQGSLAASSNYAVTYAGASLTVGQRALMVTADTQSRIYGDANPALTYAVGGLGLVNGDAITGALTTSATTASAVGSYAIAQGSLAASANYTVSYVGAPLTVNAAVPSGGGPTGGNLPIPGGSPVTVTPIDYASLASSIVRDAFTPVTLPDNARPVVGAPTIVTSLGIGVFYADPRFDSIFVCLGGGKTASACFAVK